MDDYVMARARVIRRNSDGRCYAEVEWPLSEIHSESHHKLITTDYTTMSTCWFAVVLFAQLNGLAITIPKEA